MVFVSMVGTSLAASTSTIVPTAIAAATSTSPPTIPYESLTASNGIDGTLNGTDFFINLTSTATTSNHFRSANETTMDDDELMKKDFVFDRTDVRVIFITMYTLVFCCCFFGE